jgi:hypothetical protein
VEGRRINRRAEKLKSAGGMPPLEGQVIGSLQAVGRGQESIDELGNQLESVCTLKGCIQPVGGGSIR